MMRKNKMLLLCVFMAIIVMMCGTIVAYAEVQPATDFVVTDGSAMGSITENAASNKAILALDTEYSKDGNGGIRLTSSKDEKNTNLVIPVNRDCSAYNQLEIVFYLSNWVAFDYFGWQLHYIEGETNAAVGGLPFQTLNIEKKGGWATVTYDLTPFQGKLNLLNLFLSCYLPAGEEYFIVIDCITLRDVAMPKTEYVLMDRTELPDVYEIFDGTTMEGIIENVSTESDVLSLDSEYTKDGNGGLRLKMTSTKTTLYNIVFPINQDCTKFNQLDITLYISDWASFGYLGWQLHYSDIAHGGLTFHTLTGAKAGWATISYDLTFYKDYLHLINLFLTVFPVENHCWPANMFVVVDNIVFRKVESPKTEFVDLDAPPVDDTDRTAPSIKYIKYYNLQNNVQLNDVIDLSVITVADNKDVKPLLSIEVTKEGKPISLTTDKKFTITEAGTYSVKLSSIDEAGNPAEVTLEFIAKNEPKKGCSASSFYPSSGVGMMGMLLTVCLLVFVKKSKTTYKCK